MGGVYKSRFFFEFFSEFIQYLTELIMLCSMLVLYEELTKFLVRWYLS